MARNVHLENTVYSLHTITPTSFARLLPRFPNLCQRFKLRIFLETFLVCRMDWSRATRFLVSRARPLNVKTAMIDS